MRRHITPTFCAASLLLGCGDPDTAAPERPTAEAFEGSARNVVLYLVDTLRADHLGCYGYERATSPRIDAFAAEGILFERCLAQSTWTKPATASILTGDYPARHGATNVHATLAPDLPTLAERLSGHWFSGCLTANGWINDLLGFDRGFDTFQLLSEEPAEVLVDEALAWIEARGDDPFFLYVHSLDPHDPYEPPPPYDRLFDPDYAGDVTGDVDLATTTLEERDVEHLIALYDGEIAYADAQFGRFLDGLQRLGRDGDTAVIFLSDHGEEFGDHGGWRHNPSMYQEVVSVPLICRVPGLPEDLRGLRHGGLARQIDVVPTILHLLGLAPDPTLPGSSLLERAVSPSVPVIGISEVDYAGTYRKAVIDDEMKYVRQWHPEEKELLFDLGADPGEGRNLLPEADASAESFRTLLGRFQSENNAGFSLTIQNGGDEMLDVRCLLGTRTAPLADTRFFHYDDFRAEGGIDGPIESSLVQREGRLMHVCSVRFAVAPGDVDGLHFLPAEGEKEILVAFLVGGALVPGERMLLGPSVPAWTAPVPLLVDSELLDAPAFPGHEDIGAEPYRVRIWRNMTTPTEERELSPEVQRMLEAMGYVGDE